MKNIRQTSLITLAVVISIASLGAPDKEAQASILWDQSALGTENVADQVFTDLPAFSIYVVGDVSFGTGVTISDIHTWGLPFSFSPGPTVPVEITLFAKTGSIPGPLDLPANLGPGVAAYSVTANVAEIHLSGLSIPLAAGDYWIGITPAAAIGANGQTFHLSAAVPFGDETALINPGGGFGAGTGWTNDFFGINYGDMSLLIEGRADASGSVPEAASLAVWSVMLGLCGLAIAWRRRVAE